MVFLSRNHGISFLARVNTQKIAARFNYWLQVNNKTTCIHDSYLISFDESQKMKSKISLRGKKKYFPFFFKISENDKPSNELNDDRGKRIMLPFVIIADIFEFPV